MDYIIIHLDNIKNMKEILGYTSVLLAFIGYIPYLKDTLIGKTKPHLVSWFLWTLVSFIAFGLQWSKGAGAGSYANFAMGIICLILFLLSLKNGTKSIRIIDIIFFFIALVAIYLWLIVHQPIISIILITLIDLFSFIPTFIKSWYKPWEETLFTWIISIIRQGVILLSLSNINIVTALFPLYAMMINFIFCTMVIIQRKRLKK